MTYLWIICYPVLRIYGLVVSDRIGPVLWFIGFVVVIRNWLYFFWINWLTLFAISSFTQVRYMNSYFEFHLQAVVDVSCCYIITVLCFVVVCFRKDSWHMEKMCLLPSFQISLNPIFVSVQVPPNLQVIYHPTPVWPQFKKRAPVFISTVPPPPAQQVVGYYVVPRTFPQFIIPQAPLQPWRAGKE